MDRDPSRRRVLASTGLLLAGGAVASAAGSRPVGASGAPAASAPTERWNRTYGLTRQSRARSLVEADDGTIVVAGSAISPAGSRPWLFGVDPSSGRGRWQHTLTNEERPPDAQALPTDMATTGGVVGVLGNSGGTEGVELLAATTDGEVNWRRSFSSPVDGETLVGVGVEPAGDGFLLAGYRTGDERSTALAWYVDGEGTERWRRTLFPERRSALVSARALGEPGAENGDGGESEDGYVGLVWLQERSGSTDDGDEPSPVRSALVTFDREGVGWTREYVAGSDGEPDRNSRLNGFVPTADGYLLVGRAAVDDAQAGETAGWIVATGSDGTVRTENRLQPEGFSLINAVGGGGGDYYVAGRASESALAGTSRAWLARVDPDGTARWSVTPDRRALNVFRDVLGTGDDGVAVAGVTSLDREQAWNTDGQVSGAWLVKLGGDPAPATPGEETSAPERTPTPEPTPEPTPTPTPEPTPTSTPEPSPTPSPTDGTTTSDSGPGLTAGGALAGLGGLLLSRRVRSGLSRFRDDGE